MAGITTMQQAVKENKALEYQSQHATPLALIVASENPRHEPENLYRLGYKLVDATDKERSIIHMALSEDIEQCKKLVALVEEYENDPPGIDEDTDASLENVQFRETEGEARREQSLVGLSRSLRVMQLQPCVVRTAGKSENVILLFGQRRTAAKAYLHAKSRVDVANKVKGAQVIPPVIMTVTMDVTRDQGFDYAVRENADRKGFTPLQWGAIFAEYTKRKHPKTKKPWTLKQVAETLGLSYGIVRNRHALMLPRVDDEVDESGQVVKQGKGLTDEDRAALERGEKTLTWATRRALGEKHYSATGERQTNRKKALPLKEIQSLFDDTATDNTERLKALAECMCLTLEEAIAESEERVQQSESTELRQTKPKKKKVKRKKKDTPVSDSEEGSGQGELVGAGAGAQVNF